MFSKVLIANRGAIAVRIERTLAKMGVKSVAVYSKADRDSLHVENADEAVYLGEGTAKDTYLDVDKIITAALETGAEAIHPGYGFLSENTFFASKCEENNIKFIGPDSSQIKLFGLKHSAREIAEKSGVPLLSGTGLLSGVDEAITEAEKIANEIGAKKVRILKTAGPFHTEKMIESSNAFRKDLENITVHKFETKVIKNIDGEIYKETDDVKDILARHIINPVKFSKTIENMLDNGIDTFIEIGPRKNIIRICKKDTNK